jgi:hypothetical protein
VVRLKPLLGEILVPYKAFATPARRKDAPPKIPVVRGMTEAPAAGPEFPRKVSIGCEPELVRFRVSLRHPRATSGFLIW